MKKFFSILFIIILIFSFSVICNADNEEKEIISDAVEMPAIEIPVIIPNLEVYIWADEVGKIVPVDTMITIHSELINAEYYEEFQYQWLGSEDGNNWVEIDGATNNEYTVTLNEFSIYQWYKLRVLYR